MSSQCTYQQSIAFSTFYMYVYSGVLELVQPCDHGRTNILTKRGMSIVVVFYSLPNLVAIVELGLSK